MHKLELTTGESVEINSKQWEALLDLTRRDRAPKTIQLNGRTILWEHILGLEESQKSMYERMLAMGCNMDWYRGKLKDDHASQTLQGSQG